MPVQAMRLSLERWWLEPQYYAGLQSGVVLWGHTWSDDTKFDDIIIIFFIQGVALEPPGWVHLLVYGWEIFHFEVEDTAYLCFWVATPGRE